MPMSWEAFQNTDWYRESHPDWDRKPTTEELKEGCMREYINAVDSYRERMREQAEAFAEKYDGAEFDDSCEYDENGNVIAKATYVCTKIRNGHVYGLLGRGTYEQCQMRKYEFNLANIHNEWELAGVERITYTSEDELDDILIGYREAAYEYDMYGYDDDY